MINLKEAFEDLHDRLMKQQSETIWTIKRVMSMNQKEVERFQGKGIIKDKLLADLGLELKERQSNLNVLDKLLKDYGEQE